MSVAARDAVAAGGGPGSCAAISAPTNVSFGTVAELPKKTRKKHVTAAPAVDASHESQKQNDVAYQSSPCRRSSNEPRPGGRRRSYALHALARASPCARAISLSSHLRCASSTHAFERAIVLE